MVVPSQGSLPPRVGVNVTTVNGWNKTEGKSKDCPGEGTAVVDVEPRHRVIPQ